jgi:hypothetical protein
VWGVSKEEKGGDDSGGEGAVVELRRGELEPLAKVLGDVELLAEWRALHPEITATTCAAPSAVTFETERQQKEYTTARTTTLQSREKQSTDNNDDDDDSNNNNKIDFAASLAEAVLAGLPQDDEAVQLSRIAASAGQSLQEVVERSRKQKIEQEGYAVAAQHTAGRGRIQVIGGERESLYADMGAWIDPKKMEEQMKKASSSAGKRKMTAAEVKAAKMKRQEMKEKKQRAWLQD